MKQQRRLGRFRIARELMDDAPPALFVLFGKMLVLDARVNPGTATIDFIAESQLFEPQDDCFQVRDYEIVITVDRATPWPKIQDFKFEARRMSCEPAPLRLDRAWPRFLRRLLKAIIHRMPRKGPTPDEDDKRLFNTSGK